MTGKTTDWKAIAEHLAEALRQCQVPTDWPMAWPDGTSEGTPWVDEALAAYEAALNDSPDGAMSLPRAVQKAIQDSTDATDGDVTAFLRSLFEQGYEVVSRRLLDATLAEADAAQRDRRPPPHPAQSATGDGAGEAIAEGTVRVTKPGERGGSPGAQPEEDGTNG